MKEIEVVAAIITHKNKILCVQRNENKLNYISKKYEFPGGKIEIGETKINALKREIYEELCLDIDCIEDFLTVNHNYPDFKLIMHSFICTCNNYHVTLNEHIDFQWLERGELNKLDWAAADLPIVDKLMTKLKS